MAQCECITAAVQQVVMVGDMFNTFVLELDIEDAQALRAACRSLRSAVEPHLAALAFALTRSWREVCPFTLRSWTQIWHMCAASVRAAGLHPGLWAHSARPWAWSRSWGERVQESAASTYVRDALNRVCTRQHPDVHVVPDGSFDPDEQHIAAILFVSERAEEPSCHVLLALSDERLAWVFFEHDAGREGGEGYVWTASELNCLLLRSRIRWAETRAGRLNVIAPELEFPDSDHVQHPSPSSSIGLQGLLNRTTVNRP